MAFWEVEFPRSGKYGMYGGSGFSTTINESYSGYEQRNRNWAKSRGMWTVTFQSRDITTWNNIHAFFLNVGGSVDPFRLWWPLDNTATSQACSPAAGDGANKIFQLQKTYGPVASRSYVHTIRKPITSAVLDWLGNNLVDTVKVYVNGALQGIGTHTVDHTTGLVTFVSAPAMGALVTADFQFHYPVRFDTDDMGGGSGRSNGGSSRAIIEESTNITDPIVTWQDIPLIEVRL